MITRSNLTAFGWFVSGLPDALLQWNSIDRLLYQQKRAPTIAAMNQLLGSLSRGCLGAASLGLTASLGGLIGLHAIVAHLVVVPDPVKGRARNDNLLRILKIANRFDALTDRHDWREYTMNGVRRSWRAGSSSLDLTWQSPQTRLPNGTGIALSESASLNAMRG